MNALIDQSKFAEIFGTTLPAAALDSPVLETPTQGDGSNSEETNGYPATVIRHYGEGMYEFRMPRGEVCVDISYFTAKQP